MKIDKKRAGKRLPARFMLITMEYLILDLRANNVDNHTITGDNQSVMGITAIFP
jgi:hypothetical protein